MVKNLVFTKKSVNSSLVRLNSDGTQQDIVASFDGNPACANTFTNVISAPAACFRPCRIDGVTRDSAATCNSNTNRYKEYLTINYTAGAGVQDPKNTIVVDGRPFLITQSPQKVVAFDLVADGQSHSFDVYFSENPTCRYTYTYTAPIACQPLCDITKVEAKTQMVCEEETNTYSQIIEVEYANAPKWGNLSVNGQEFAITTSPQQVILSNLPSDGQTVKVKVAMTNDKTCVDSLTTFIAPIKCSLAPCAIKSIKPVKNTGCDPTSSRYTQSLEITYDRPASGILYVNDRPFSIKGSPDTVSLAGLQADNNLVDVHAYFSTDSSGCNLTKADVFKAPVPCLNLPCRIDSVTLGNQTACDNTNDYFTQEVLVYYSNKTSTGTLVVNNEEYQVTASPITITIDSLTADGNDKSVLVYFKDDAGCQFIETGFIKGVESCKTVPCKITGVIKKANTTCDPNTNTFSQSLEIIHEGAPFGEGNLRVNGQTYSIGASPQTILLEGLESDGTERDVTVWFDNDSSACAYKKPNAFTAQAYCLPCKISSFSKGFNTDCDPLTNTNAQQVIVTYSNKPASGKLNVNGQQFDIKSSPQMVVLEDLLSNDTDVNVSAFFTNETQCKLDSTALFKTPVSCQDPNACAITNVTTVTQTVCDPESNTFNQVIEVTYKNAPANDSLVINGKSYLATSSAQRITLDSITSSGNKLDVNVFFKSELNCKAIVRELIQTPESCVSSCIIDSIVMSTPTSCVEKQTTFDQEMTVYFKDAPQNGILNVNGTEEYVGTSSPASFTLRSLQNEPRVQGVVAFFKTKTNCIYTNPGAIVVPVSCKSVGVLTDKLNKEIILYPNPAQNTIHINKGSIKLDALKITDITGREVVSLKGDYSLFNVSELPTGIYLVQILTQGQIIYKKVEIIK